MPRVIIIGGGIAGLAAAVHLKQGAKVHDKQLDVLLLEKDSRVGGKILTEKVGSYLVEAGPDSFLPEKVQTVHLARHLGLEAEMLPSNDEHKGTFIFSGGRLHSLPEGVMLMVPTMFMPMVRSNLITWPGKLRMGMEVFVPRRKLQGDESLGSFVTRRLGKECLDKIAEPLVAGIHTSNPDNMSVEATFPRFLQMERTHGSLIRGMLASMKNRPHATLSGPAKAKPSGPKMTYFMSFRKGMQTLSQACADHLGPASIRTGASVVSVEPRGKGYAVILQNGETLEADHVMVGTSSYDASRMVRNFAPDAADQMDRIDWSSSGNVSLAFRREDVKVPLKGFGFIIPKLEDRRINATTYSSIKWSYRAPDDRIMLRAFVGGGNREDLVYDLDDRQMVQTVLEELDAIVGIRAEPELARVYRWYKSMPKYTVGHMDRMAILDRTVAAYPGLHLLGCSYKGIGIGGCVQESLVAAEKVLRS